MPPRSLFADTFYWVALLNPGDASHARVTSFGRGLGMARLMTTDDRNDTDCSLTYGTATDC